METFIYILYNNSQELELTSSLFFSITSTNYCRIVLTSDFSITPVTGKWLAVVSIVLLSHKDGKKQQVEKFLMMHL